MDWICFHHFFNNVDLKYNLRLGSISKHVLARYAQCCGITKYMEMHRNQNYVLYLVVNICRGSLTSCLRNYPLICLDFLETFLLNLCVLQS